jgi:hypothetical protein
MDVRDLVRALLRFDALMARDWVAEASRRGFRWGEIAAPTDLGTDELALAAGVVELLAERAGEEPPTWTSGIADGDRRVFLVQAAKTMPRLREACETQGPEPLRRRGFLAPPEFLTIA